MNLALRLFGLRSDARRRTSWLFVIGMLAFVGAMVFTAVHVWHVVDTSMFQHLNGCVDSRSKSFGSQQELPYHPSPEYVSCVNGIHRTTAVEASFTVGLMICATVAFIAWEIESFVNAHAWPVDGSQARTYRFSAVYIGCLIAGVGFVLAFRATLDPYAS